MELKGSILKQMLAPQSRSVSVGISAALESNRVRLEIRHYFDRRYRIPKIVAFPLTE